MSSTSATQNGSRTHSNQAQQDGASSHYALIVLLIAYILSFIDRNIMAVLVGPIRADFGISDTEFSLLHGFAFTFIYIFLGLPIGWLADRYSRKWIIAGGVFFWSLMTAACGFAKSFGTLFAARVGVGVGEASLSPAAYSLLGDAYSANRLRWATSVFAMGITIGSGISYKLGGWMYDKLNTSDLSAYPIINDMAPWQITFLGVGLPGLLLVIGICLIKEPARVVPKNESAEAIPLNEVIAYLKQHWQIYSSIMFGVSLMAVIGYGTLTWYVEFLLRTYNMSKTLGGSALGDIFIYAGTAGTLFGAVFASFLQKRGFSDANLRTFFIAACLLIVPASLAPLMPSAELSILLTWFVVFIHYTHFGVAMASLQIITPNKMRAQVSALLLFIANLFGLALGSTIIAAFTDFVFAGDHMLRYSISTVSAICYPGAALLILWGMKYYRQMLAQQHSTS